MARFACMLSAHASCGSLELAGELAGAAGAGRGPSIFMRPRIRALARKSQFAAFAVGAAHLGPFVYGERMTSEGPLLAAPGNASDRELWDLLCAVYVGGGFTAAELAPKVFAADAVRARGSIITARDRVTGALLGMIILVPPGAAARRVARDAEAEVHLLAVHPDARKGGIGRALVHELLALAAARGWEQLLLSTQGSMHAAHALYESVGFARVPERDWEGAGHRFMAYQRAVSLPAR